MNRIKVADRYPFPGPRYRTLEKGAQGNSSSSGEDFRDWIEDELRKSESLTIDLDGTVGYGSSFLEEAFGGLIRAGYASEIVLGIELISFEEPELIDEIKKYINDAIALRGD